MVEFVRISNSCNSCSACSACSSFGGCSFGDRSDRTQRLHHGCSTLTSSTYECTVNLYQVLTSADSADNCFNSVPMRTYCCT